VGNDVVKYVVVDFDGEIYCVCDFPDYLNLVISIKDNQIIYINKNNYEKWKNSRV